MGAVYDALVSLAPEQDMELLDGYRRYESQLANILTSEQMEAYASYIRETGEIRVFDEMTPDELAALSAEVAAIATAVLADVDTSLENRRVAALLNQRGEHGVAPDLGPPVGG